MKRVMKLTATVVMLGMSVGAFAAYNCNLVSGTGVKNEFRCNQTFFGWTNTTLNIDFSDVVQHGSAGTYVCAFNRFWRIKDAVHPPGVQITQNIFEIDPSSLGTDPSYAISIRRFSFSWPTSHQSQHVSNFLNEDHVTYSLTCGLLK